MHELIGSARAACPDAPARNQFRIRVERNPSPHVSKAKLTLFISGHILVFGVAELPNFIALNVLAG
jgi:hypothetical protein